jgi:hypothetical protein
MENLALFAIVGVLGSKLLDVVRYARGQDWNAVVTQAAAWAVGVALTFVASAADTFGTLVVPGINVPLNDLDGWSKVLVGTAILSLLSKVVDLQKTFDNTQSAAVPNLTNK